MKPKYPPRATDGTVTADITLIEVPEGSISPSGTVDLSGAIESAAHYKLYAANMTQSSTDAPQAVVLQNTLGGTVVWNYEGPGVYLGTLAGAFTEGKTPTLTTLLSLSAGRQVSVSRTDADTVQLQVIQDDVPSDDVLSETYIEIRVFY